MPRLSSVVLIAVLLTPLAHAGKLDKVRHEVREDSRDDDDKKERKKPRKRSRPRHACNPSSSLFITVEDGPDYVETEYAGETYVLEQGPPPDCCFLEYPYAEADLPGYLWIEGDDGLPWEHSMQRRHDVTAQVWAEAGTDFDGLSRVGGRALIDTSGRLGLLGGADVFFEDDYCGCTDSLVIGDFNGTFRFAQTEHLALRAGVGGRFLSDEYDTGWGFNFLVRADVYPSRPLVLSAQLDLGSLGDASLWRFRGTCGYQWHRCEVFVGYDHLDIEGAELTGLIAGFKLTF